MQSKAEVVAVIGMALVISTAVSGVLIWSARPPGGWLAAATIWASIAMASVGATLAFYLTFKIRSLKRAARGTSAKKTIGEIPPAARGLIRGIPNTRSERKREEKG